VDNGVLFPVYIPRDEEALIRGEALRVRADRASRAVLLYGAGGCGKTRLLRQLAHPGNGVDEHISWLEPIDVDDSEYWLLSNLERHVAKALDPQDQYFGAYHEYLSRLPSYMRPRIGHETVISHLSRIKRVFRECYTSFVEDSGKTVVLLFDTVETIRGTSLLLTLTQWMKALPSTLFVLSGRPLPPGQTQDPIRSELADTYQGMPLTLVYLGDFSFDAALAYIEGSSRIAGNLTVEEKEKLVLLTRGHPLWLAFTLSYLDGPGMPEEAEAALDVIRAAMPFAHELRAGGKAMHEEFKRRLVTPYRDTDFWHEAIKRLAVVRLSVSQPIWQLLMDDLPLPAGVPDMNRAWDMLLQTPWIRPRANSRCVTLHDAVAEELAQRIIPLHDQDRRWRLKLWNLAAEIYRDLTAVPEAQLHAELEALDERLQDLRDQAHHEGRDRLLPKEEGAYIAEVARLDSRKSELDQFEAVGLFYRLLCDFDEGCQLFLDLFGEAKHQHEVLFEDLLALEMQRFLPAGFHSHAFGDVVGEVIDDFREWLGTDGKGWYLKIGLSMADYLINEEQAEAALALMDLLPEAAADLRQRYELAILRGNACMRVPGRVKDGLDCFGHALTGASRFSPPDRGLFTAKAEKELGFYYRNEGRWNAADQAYERARDAISENLLMRDSEEDREEMASIQTNWAYVKGLVGSYRDGMNLAESAITMRKRLGSRQAEGNSWSVCGEVYRYERRFEKAWMAYAEAEQIFHELRNWSWLGLIYQEQAICLYQAWQDEIVIEPGRDPLEQAKHLITLALDICEDQAVRGYPSALNRAGRIFGHEDIDAGLEYLAKGIEWGRRLSDGWFWFANLIEYAELSYRAWVETGQDRYLAGVTTQEAAIGQAASEYQFYDLRGRWNLLQGHLGIHDWLESAGQDRLDAALYSYAEGFAMIARGYVGSSGASAIPNEFRQFKGMLDKLPAEIRAEWLRHLRRAWSATAVGPGSTQLLARLEELY
jgi:hypothetical protein